MLITTVKPTGTVTIGSPEDRKYTFAEITDLINEALAQQKYVLIRRHLTFFLHPADEKIDSTMVPRVELNELPKRGRTEIVQVLLPLNHLVAADVQDELKRLLTPFGVIVSFQKQNALLVQDTVGSIERIRQTLEALDKPAPKPEKPAPLLVKMIDLKALGAADIAPEVRKLIGPESHCIALAAQKQLLIVGTAEEIAQIVKYVDELEEKPKKPAPAPKKYSVNFAQLGWKQVCTWYSFESGLERLDGALPTGTFTLLAQNGTQYTLAEITDLINDALLAEKWLLVRNEKEFAIVPADEKVDPKFVRRIAVSDIGERGRTELVEIEIKPDGVPVAVLVPIVRKLNGPFGARRVNDKANTLVVQDTAGNLLRIVNAVSDQIEKQRERKRENK
jgi:hypothetical protein